MNLVLSAKRLISEKIECRESQIKIILLETGNSNSTNEQQRISEKNNKSMNKNRCPAALILPFTK
jgi:hypothetical protein